MSLNPTDTLFNIADISKMSLGELETYMSRISFLRNRYKEDKKEKNKDYYAYLYIIKPDNIIPFEFKELTNIDANTFLSKCEYFIDKPLKFGDMIQLFNNDRNNNKYIWNNGWFDFVTDDDAMARMVDYGVLPIEFSVLNPNSKLPLKYFKYAMYYNWEQCPWDPDWYSNELHQNYNFEYNNLKVSTYFTHNNVKHVIQVDISYIYDNLNGFYSTGSHGGSTSSTHYFKIENSKFHIPSVYHQYMVENVDNLRKGSKFSLKFDAPQNYSTIRQEALRYDIDNNICDMTIIKNKFMDIVFSSQYLEYEKIDQKSYIFIPIW
jgi:hypothetical protein